MPHVLLTGANGFVGSHILNSLLSSGYSVTAVIRSEKKAKDVAALHPGMDSKRLDFAIVEDMCIANAFDKALQHQEPFDAVIHCASAFRFNVEDVKKELLEPAISGTINLLRAIVKNSPTVKRFILTSSFAAIENPHKGPWPEHVYSETDWSPLTFEDGLKNPFFGYLASKALSEKAAWEFVSEGHKTFTMTAINPPMIFGPVIQALNKGSRVNTSNQFIQDLVFGKHCEKLPNTGPFYWVDVRDVAQAHVTALKEPAAAGKRFIVSPGTYSNQDICEITRAEFPKYASRLPSEGASGGGLPLGGVAKIDSSLSTTVLKLKYRSLRSSVVDVIQSLETANLVAKL